MFRLIFLLVVGVSIAVGAAIWYSDEGKQARKTLAPVVDEATKRAGDVGERVGPVLKKKVHEMTAEDPKGSGSGSASASGSGSASGTAQPKKKPAGPGAAHF